MNENIDFTKILKDCPEGWKFWSSMYGEVLFKRIDKNSDYPIVLTVESRTTFMLVRNGKYSNVYDGECTLFPSKEQRDWSKFTAPWYKKDKFDPKTLKPFDKVLVSDEEGKYEWTCKFFSHYRDYELNKYRYATTANVYKYCIPYNDETKHLVGTKDEAPEYYRYWEECV